MNSEWEQRLCFNRRIIDVHVSYSQTETNKVLNKGIMNWPRQLLIRHLLKPTAPVAAMYHHTKWLWLSQYVPFFLYYKSAVLLFHRHFGCCVSGWNLNELIRSCLSKQWLQTLTPADTHRRQVTDARPGTGLRRCCWPFPNVNINLFTGLITFKSP